MADFSAIIAQIQAYIRANGRFLISGPVLQDQLVDLLGAVNEKKQDTLTFDTTPTAGSTNPVTSGGILNALKSYIPKLDIVQTLGTATDKVPSVDLLRLQVALLQTAIGAKWTSPTVVSFDDAQGEEPIATYNGVDYYSQMDLFNAIVDQGMGGVAADTSVLAALGITPELITDANGSWSAGLIIEQKQLEMFWRSLFVKSRNEWDGDDGDYYDFNDGEYWLSFHVDRPEGQPETITGHFSRDEELHRSDINQSTGISISSVMSQKAVTDALAGKAASTDLAWEKGTGEKSAKLKGTTCAASGSQSVAEGNASVASGNNSHAEGRSTASGGFAHAEGDGCEASNTYSHAEGRGTKTAYSSAHVEGKFNVGITNTIHEVGIGTADGSRKNAHTIGSDGKHYIPGVGGYVGTETSLAGKKDLATVIAKHEETRNLLSMMVFDASDLEFSEPSGSGCWGVVSLGLEEDDVYKILRANAVFNIDRSGETWPRIDNNWLNNGSQYGGNALVRDSITEVIRAVYDWAPHFVPLATFGFYASNQNNEANPDNVVDTFQLVTLVYVQDDGGDWSYCLVYSENL